MSLLNSLEARLGRFAIPGLIRIIVAFNALVFALYKLNPGYLAVLSLDRQRIMAGEVWRLVTFLFIPSIGSPIFDWLMIVFYLGFLWMVGEGLEHALGAFRLNLFYLIGMIGTALVAFLFDAGSATMLNTSLFFAFARFYPDTMIYLFWILPVKIRWLAWLLAAQILFSFLFADDNSYRAVVLISFANYLLFFGPEIWHAARHRTAVKMRRQEFERAAIPEEEPLHQCAVCHRTEATNPELDFRVSRDGHEYCVEHLPAKVVAQNPI